LRKCDIFVYGAGSLATMTQKWLVSAGASKITFCVDDEYISRDTNSVPIQDCIHAIVDGSAILVIGIGARSSWQEIEKFGISKVYSVYNPYDFWRYADIPVRELYKFCSQIDNLYSDELSRRICWDYVDSIRKGNGVDEEKNCLALPPYFNELTKYIEEGIYIDIGAYTGDTIEEFRKFYGNSHNIVALEPDNASFEALENKYKNDSKISLKNVGAWKENGRIGFQSGNGQRSEVSKDSDECIDVVKIDSIVEKEKVSFIKIGNDFPVEILEGARQTIRKYHPIVVMFAVYHFELLGALPLFFKTIDCMEYGYKVFLRHHSSTSCGLLFVYAIPEKL